MALPKRKTTPSKRGKRRSHHALKVPKFVINKDTGELQQPHRVSLDGYYNGKQVMKKKVKQNK